MNVIYKPRQQGKTTDLIKRAAEIDGQIITNTVLQVAFVQEMADKLGLTIKPPLSIRQFSLHLDNIAASRTPLLIDDAEYCLQYLINSDSPYNRITVDSISVNDYDKDGADVEHSGHTN